ncbi:MAG: DNA repair exonuclease [Halomonadaceae bacterium]|nr:MAG: DNA repair exonuclease [Halomonadaceae bacterium]
MELTILAVGDLHLGAAPSRLPAPLAARAEELGAAAVWRRIVDQAISRQVHAVVLAGDLVEDEDDFFEAYRELAQGVERLVAANIRVLGIVGNHDVKVLPRLADQIAGFELLGRNGQWQTLTLSQGSESLTLHGWSFPQKQVSYSPLAGIRFEQGPGVNLGLLHGDRDQPQSPYAPVSSPELAGAALDGWLLGHIHKPDALTAPHPSGYLGSATGLHPGESGPRGPWLLTVSGGTVSAMEHWLIAPLHWQPLAVDLTGIGHEDDARERLMEALSELDKTLNQRPLAPEAVALRVTFNGRSDLAARVQSLMQGEDLQHLSAGTLRIHYFIESLIYAIEPVLPLETLAQRSDPVGLLAQRLLLLQQPGHDPQRQHLLTQARQQMLAQQQRSWWQALDNPPPDDEAVAHWLWQAGLLALEQLLAQKGSAQ